MTDETKRRVELVRLAVVGKGPGDHRYRIARITMSRADAEAYARHLRQLWTDVEIRPLYDADVPALVEALERIADMANVRIRHYAREALASLEETDE